MPEDTDHIWAQDSAARKKKHYMEAMREDTDRIGRKTGLV